MDKQNRKFADYVTSVSFNLSLSKSMVIVLAQVYTNTHCMPKSREFYTAFGCRDNYVQTVGCLQDRGLVYSPDAKYPGLVELTAAGKHVVELLKLAGLIQKVQAVNSNLGIKGRKKAS